MSDLSNHPVIIKLNEAGDYKTKKEELIYNWIRQRVLSYKDFRIVIEYLKERERERLYA